MALCGDRCIKVVVKGKNVVAESRRYCAKMAPRYVVQKPCVCLIREEIATRGRGFSGIEVPVVQHHIVISQIRKITLKTRNRDIKPSDEAVLDFNGWRLEPEGP